MAIWSASGTFNTGTGAPGNLSAITGLPGTPQRIRFWAIAKSTAGTLAGINFMTGVAVSASSRFALSYAVEDNVNPSSTGDTGRNTAVLVELLLTGGSNPTAEGGFLDVASFDANGFTPAVDVTFTTDSLVFWHAIGGGTAVTIKEAISNSASAQTYTSVGCTPSFIEVFTAHKATANAGVNSSAYYSYGVYDGTTYGCVAGYSRDNQSSSSDIRSIISTTNIAIELSTAGDTSTTGWNTPVLSGTGVTITRSSGTAAHCLYIVCYEGYTVQVGTTPEFNDTADHLFTSTGLNPLELTLFARPDVTANQTGTPTGNNELSYGFASKNTGTIGRSAAWIGHRDISASDANEQSASDRCFLNRTNTGGALSGDVDCVRLGYEGFTLDQVTADSTVPLIIYWALGSPPAVGVTTAPSGAVDGADFTTQPVIQLKDASGNNTSDTTNVVATVVSGSATLSGTTTKAAVAGVATFTNLRLTGSTGSHTVRFTAGSAFVDSTFTVASATITPTELRFTTQPVTTVVGVAMPSFVVSATNSSGVVGTGYNSAVTISWNTNPNSAPSITTTKSCVSGVVTFTGVVVNTLQTNASFNAVSSNATITLTASNSTYFNITAAAVGGGSHFDSGHIRLPRG